MQIQIDIILCLFVYVVLRQQNNDTINIKLIFFKKNQQFLLLL